ncbi:MAG: hypothetical protein NTU53_09300 [Planctomycetota bacterium]|nr:hypothetical protein [Planctomycetota bacterium]
MPNARPGLKPLLFLGVGLSVLLVGSLLVRERLLRPEEGGSVRRVVVVATQPATKPVVEVPEPPRSYMELVRRVYRSYPTTQPLEEPVGLEYAGHFAFREAVYLDNTGRLWITRADAGATETVLGGAGEQQVILTREQPVYVHWVSGEKGEAAYLVCRRASGEGYELVSGKQRQVMGGNAKYEWGLARSWEDKIVVPTEAGVTVFTVGNRVGESASPSLVEAGRAHAPVQITFTAGGPLAWIPPQEGDPGSSGAVRCVEDAWRKLADENSWPSGLVHLIPLLDGSVLQLIADEGEVVKLNVVPLDPMSGEEEKQITELVVQLSDPDGAKRGKAYEELTRYGPGLWAIAEKMMDGEPPETRARLKDLLRSKVSPLLGGMQLVDGRLRVLWRYADGGVLFYAEHGVSILQGEDQPVVISPAWLSALPGESIRLLGQDLVRGLDVAKVRLMPWGPEWIVTDEANGPRRFLGGELVPLLSQRESAYGEFVGIGRGGRYVFRKAVKSVATTRSATQPTTRPATQPTTQATAGETALSEGTALIVDPRLPDPIPRLPVWNLVYPTATVGWDKNDWPAAKQKNGWALGAREWRVLEESETFYSTAEQVPAWPGVGGTTRPATGPTTGPTTGPVLSTRPSEMGAEEKPILVDAGGEASYYDGRKGLRVVRRDGSRVSWGLPEEARGAGDVHLVRTGDGTLFLFNQPGRVVRIRPTAGGAEPFAVEATFTRRIPRAEHPARIWLDPFGRICIAYDENKLALLFPRGYIPAEIVNLMTAEDQRQAVEE